ncbi:archaellin/type IV pilin N-terminal domain-containing protein [Natronomonas gomsonensis]|uniref:archaellin/type IV pilin N-terminal domain-containing protein n=1 Tax=Natronomonas gomsonensis TaxID=1046043 RepID=UPI0015C14625|nr:archaellin/type IV pilin N-terminal domain-containing protein [Natronomonas gomsonensis]
MIPKPTDDDRGQVGIGTLIIFIALVLVAAVAAGVLVQTSGLLQSQAESTGEDAQSEVGNQISIVSATGSVDSANEAVEEVNLTVKKSAGSDPIDLEDATIEYTSAGASETLIYGDTSNATNFATTNISASSSTVMTNSGGRVQITINTSSLEDGSASSGGIVAGDEATLRIVDQSGATTIYGVNVPDSLGERDYVSV